MHFNDLDKMMRVYEESSDQKVLPNIYMVARLDGNGFSKLTKKLGFKKPFDIKFNSYMSLTVYYLMKETGFTFRYGYHQSDEISLLFSLDENTFGRKLRKLNSILAAKTSAYFTYQLGEVVAFDCRISQLPTKVLVEDYFSWRQADATRNALHGYCYWALRENGNSARKATSMLNNANDTYKKAFLLSAFDIDFNTTDTWTRNGTGLYFKKVTKEGFNPVTKKTTKVKRNKLIIDNELPTGLEYRNFIGGLLDG